MFGLLKKNKVLSLTVIITAILLCSATVLLLNNYRSAMMEHRKEEVRLHVMKAYELLDYYRDKVKTGELTNLQAKNYASQAVRVISPPTNKYYWINDINSIMVMHADTPDLEGKNLVNYKGPDGQYLFKEMTVIAKKKNEGFIKYLWEKPDHQDGDTLYPKISYIKYYKPWDWIVGSGVYYEDIDDAFIDAILIVASIGFAVILFMWMLGITVFETLKK